MKQIRTPQKIGLILLSLELKWAIINIKNSGGKNTKKWIVFIVTLKN